MSLVQEIIDLKEKNQRMKTKHDQAQGAHKENLKKMKSLTGKETIKEAEDVLAEKENQIQKDEKKLEKHLEKIKEKYGEV